MIDFLRLQMIRLRTLLAYRQKSWRTIEIRENYEPLILVPEEMSMPYYCSVMNLTDDRRIYLRQTVLEKVFVARRLLQSKGFDLMVYDGWRSLELQSNLFWYYMKEFTSKKFNQEKKFQVLNSFSEIESYFNSLSPDLRSLMFEANRIYVSWPSKDLNSPSPHTTGGAVDVWLFKNGQAVNLGVPFDWMEDNAGAFYHLKLARKKFAGNDSTICQNRTEMLLAMTAAGFTCYGPEIWHFNYGNQMDALVKSTFACYSYIEPRN